MILGQVGEYKSGKAKEMACLSKTLATIVMDIDELEVITLDSLELDIEQAWKNEVFDKYEFKSLIK